MTDADAEGSGSSRTAFSAVLVGAVLVRGFDLSAQAFSMDEVSAVEAARATFGTILLHPDSFPPLYLWLLKSWSAVFPLPMAARWLSITLGAVAVWAVWRLGEELVDGRTGLVASALLAGSAFHVYYSQMARAYSLYLTVAALALLFFVRAARRDTRGDWAAFVIASLVGVFTHYYFALLLAVSLVALLAARGRSALTARAVSAYGVIGVFAIAVIPLISSDLSFQTSLREPRSLGLGALGYTYFSMLTGYSVGPSRPELNQMTTLEAAGSALPWILLAGAPLIVLLAHGYRPLRERGHLITVVLFLALPVALAGLVGSAAGVTYNDRFVLWCVLPLIGWAAAGVTHGWRSPLVKISLVALIVLQGTAMYNRAASDRYRNEDTRALAQYLEATPDGSLPVFISSDYMAKPLRYYLSSRFPLITLPEPGEYSRVINDRSSLDQAIRTIEQLSQEGRGFRLVYSRPFHGDPNGLLLSELGERGGLELEASWSGLDLYRVVPSPEPADP